MMYNDSILKHPDSLKKTTTTLPLVSALLFGYVKDWMKLLTPETNIFLPSEGARSML